MPLTSTVDLVAPAAAASHGIGAFNVVQLEHAEALVAGAERAETPIILQISENTVRYHGALAPIGLATLAAARAATVPVAVHLDHATRTDLVREAVELGFPSVMFDASALEYAENEAATAEVVRHCHANGVVVEAELGEVGGKDGVHAPGARTDPGDAQRFVERTGVDMLAVAVGTSHAMVEQTATLDFALIERLRATVSVPLVLHGSSGVSDSDLGRAVRAGITKVNIATRLNATFTEAARAWLRDNPNGVDPRRYLGAARDAVADELPEILRTLTGTAAETPA